MIMRSVRNIVFLLSFLVIAGCITQFVPETKEKQELLVVEGLITDQPEVNTVKLSMSLPLGERNQARPLTGCRVILSDDQENQWTLSENSPGSYETNPYFFRGVVGRKYKLNIYNVSGTAMNYSYETFPVEMKPVPAIDSLYYEKVTLREKDPHHVALEGCQIYLDANDPSGNCKFFRWDYTETWEFHLPFSRPVNKICWQTNTAREINIKSTAILSENRIERQPLKYISNESDRLKVKYSLLVNQYSLTEDEYDYWEKLQNINQNVGSLYDIIPAAIPSNIYCVENPSEKVLGYFSVSAKSSKRIFIEQNFSGQANPYAECISDTIFGSNPTIPGLNSYVWILEATDNPFINPQFTVLTVIRGCADCTVRGSPIKPDFWDNEK
jgi:hypothetical protein